MQIFFQLNPIKKIELHLTAQLNPFFKSMTSKKETTDSRGFFPQRFPNDYRSHLGNNGTYFTVTTK